MLLSKHIIMLTLICASPVLGMNRMNLKVGIPNVDGNSTGLDSPLPGSVRRSGTESSIKPSELLSPGSKNEDQKEQPGPVQPDEIAKLLAKKLSKGVSQRTRSEIKFIDIFEKGAKHLKEVRAIQVEKALQRKADAENKRKDQAEKNPKVAARLLKEEEQVKKPEPQVSDVAKSDSDYIRRASEKRASDFVIVSNKYEQAEKAGNKKEAEKYEELLEDMIKQLEDVVKPLPEDIKSEYLKMIANPMNWGLSEEQLAKFIEEIMRKASEALPKSVRSTKKPAAQQPAQVRSGSRRSSSRSRARSCGRGPGSSAQRRQRSCGRVRKLRNGGTMEKIDELCV